LNQRCRETKRDRSGERGSITVLTAVMLVGLVLAVGLCLDVARIYMVRAQLQNAADAAALAAAREFNSGIIGINQAAAAAQSSALSSSNGFGLGKTSITIASVGFAQNLNGAYTTKAQFDAMSSTAKASFAATARFVRVTTSVANVSILFTIGRIGASRSETAVATAGRSIELNTICNLFPIAVAKTNPTTSFPSGQEITLTFRDGTGTTFDIQDRNYVVLATNGNGASDTRDASSGTLNTCAAVGQQYPVNKSSSANTQNGPYQIADGLNTRFNIYPQGNQLSVIGAPPDTNIYQDPLFSNYNWTNYKNGSPAQDPNITPTPPSTNYPNLSNTRHQGVEFRRILVMPIVSPGTYANAVTIQRFGAFLALREVFNPKQPSQCSNTTTNPCGKLYVQYLGDDFVIGGGYYDPNNPGTSNLTVPVLYK
jgi:Flp pilus assembly protein TadG